MVFEGKNTFQFEVRHLWVQEIYVCILREWPLSTRICQCILAMKKTVLTRLLIQLINYPITSCIFYSSFPCIINIIFFYPFKKSMGNKREKKRRANNQNTHLELNHSIPYAKTAGTSFCPFPWTDVLIKKKIRTWWQTPRFKCHSLALWFK